MTNMNLSNKMKISVAPHFFNYNEYFNDLNKFFIKWMGNQITKIEKRYGYECMERIDNGEIPIDEEYEKRMNKSLKGEELKKWRDSELNCFLAYVELSDISVKQMAFYNSFLIFIFSDFENVLGDICNQYALKTKQKITMKDIAGRGIERSINYLDKVAEFTLPGVKLQEEILLIRDIRNCIAHAGGKINNPKLLKRVEKSSFLKIIDEPSEEKSIYLDERYCKHAIKLIDKYIIELTEKNNKFLWHWSFGMKALM